MSAISSNTNVHEDRGVVDEKFAGGLGPVICAGSGTRAKCGGNALSGSPYCYFHLKDDHEAYSKWWEQTVLSRINSNEKDFRDLWLEHVDFSRANLNFAHFDHSQLEGATFKETSLKSSSFTKANLSSTTWDEAIFDRTNFQYARLTHAKFKRLDFFRCNFRACNANAAMFKEVLLDGCDWMGSELRAARFERSYFVSCNLRKLRAFACELRLSGVRRSEMEFARFDDATFVGVDFSDSNSLEKSSLTDAYFTACIFSNDSQRANPLLIKKKGAVVTGSIGVPNEEFMPRDRSDAIDLIFVLIALRSGIGIDDPKSPIAVDHATIVRLVKVLDRPESLPSRSDEVVRRLLGDETNREAAAASYGLAITTAASVIVGGTTAAWLPIAGMVVGGAASHGLRVLRRHLAIAE